MEFVNFNGYPVPCATMDLANQDAEVRQLLALAIAVALSNPDVERVLRPRLISYHRCTVIWPAHLKIVTVDWAKELADLALLGELPRRRRVELWESDPVAYALHLAAAGGVQQAPLASAVGGDEALAKLRQNPASASDRQQAEIVRLLKSHGRHLTREQLNERDVLVKLREGRERLVAGLRFVLDVARKPARSHSRAFPDRCTSVLAEIFEA
jgi:hypothetical protein